MEKWECQALLTVWCVTVVSVVALAAYDAGGWGLAFDESPMLWPFLASPIIPLCIWLLSCRNP